jgi:FkbM family methyltransferase
VLWDTFFGQFQAPPPEIDNPQCIVDLGANVGYTSAYFAAKYPAARILSVEMDDENVGLARRNLHSFGDRCTVVHAAVWCEDTSLEYAGEEEQGFRVTALLHSPVSSRGRVLARSINGLLEEHGIDVVDYLKMDIEGAEKMVLGSHLEWTDRVRAMKVELHPPATYETCSRTLEARGFTCRPDGEHDSCLVAVRKAAI